MSSLFLRYALLVLMLTTLAGCSLLPGRRDSSPGVERAPATEQPSLRRIYSLENKVLDRINEIRKRNGLGSLKMHGKLRKVARGHSRDMADNNFFDHRNLAGELPDDRVVRAEIDFKSIGENIAFNRGAADPVDVAIAGWMKSKGHRENILDSEKFGWTHTGIGIAVSSNGKYYFTQLFLKTS